MSSQQQMQQQQMAQQLQELQQKQQKWQQDLLASAELNRLIDTLKPTASTPDIRADLVIMQTQIQVLVERMHEIFDRMGLVMPPSATPEEARDASGNDEPSGGGGGGSGGSAAGASPGSSGGRGGGGGYTTTTQCPHCGGTVRLTKG